MFFNKLLIINYFFPIIGIFFILIIPEKEKRFLKIIAFDCCILIFILFLIIWLFFDKSISRFQFLNKIIILPFFNINLTLGVDGISLFFLLLTTFLICLCILSSWDSIHFLLKEFLILFLLINFFLINVFCALDLLYFYIFFESSLIPIFLIIGIWGSRERKTLANFYFFLYTLLGSIFMLLAIFYIILQIGSTDYEIILNYSFSKVEQKILWFCFFLSFASKIPMFPTHLWLPEAHVEAPTAGSVLLAGILLKLGTYGFIRFSLSIFPKASLFFLPLIYTLAIIGIIYTSFTAIRQTDFKRIIAYTSIAHMNLVVLGIFSFNNLGIQGAIFQSISHGFISSGLFLIIGILYDRFKTRLIQYFGGLTIIIPIYVCLFFFFSLANMGFPGISNFIGEFLILVGCIKINLIIILFSGISIIISSVYTLWLFNRICYGNLKIQYLSLNTLLDINYREVLIVFPLILGSTISGIYSNFFMDSINISVNYLLELIYI